MIPVKTCFSCQTANSINSEYCEGCGKKLEGSWDSPRGWIGKGYCPVCCRTFLKSQTCSCGDTVPSWFSGFGDIYDVDE
jgi:predicted amidophosphoribosyltransferase